MRSESAPRKAAVIRVLILGLLLALPGRAAAASGYALPLDKGGSWGPTPADVVADIKAALEQSGFMDAVEAAGGLAEQVAQGKVPAIDDLKGIVDGDVQAIINDTIGQATDASQLLAMVDVAALQQLFTTLGNVITTPQEFAFSIPGGRLVFKRDLIDISLCAVVAGAGGARITLGMSGGEQLCGNPSERFYNPTQEPMLFADLALGYSHIQARRKLFALPPVSGPDPAMSIQAATYFPIHGDWVQLRFAGNDPQSLSLTLQFVVGVKGGVSAKLQAEIEGQVMLELVVKPTQVAAMLQDINDIITTELNSTQPAGLQINPTEVAGVIKLVADYLKGVEDSGEELGELSISVAVDGGVGVGIWDTGINLGSVGAQLKLGVPLESIVALQGELLATYLASALGVSEQLVSLFEAMSEGRLDEAELASQRSFIGTAATAFAQGIFAAYVDYIQDIELSFEAGVYALGDIGQVAAQTIPLLVFTADIPVGQIFVDGINGIPAFVDGISETAQAVAWLAEMVISAGLQNPSPLSLGGIISAPSDPSGYVQRPRGPAPTPPTAEEWETMAAGLLDGVTFSLRMGVIGVEDVSLGNFVRLAGGASEVMTSLLAGAMRSAIEKSEKPLLDALRAAPGQIGNEALSLLIFNLQTLSVATYGTVGASGTVGAEVAVGIGGSIGFEGRVKASLLLLALNSSDYDEPDETLLAGIDIPMELSASAGVSVGEGVEFSAEGGLTIGQSLANLTLKDWGSDLPAPAGLTVAGFEVIEFVGESRQDGTIEGSGWIVLPMGGLVRADSFVLNAQGDVVSGSWSGVIELGPLGTLPIISGAITDGGLVGQFNLAIGASQLASNFRLRSDGLLFGNATGNLNIAGAQLANIDLELTDKGNFSGTANMAIGGQPAVSVLLEVGPHGAFGSFVNSLSLFGTSTTNAWFRIAESIEVYGEMDTSFLQQFKELLRAQLLGGISDAQQTLQNEQAKLAGFQSEIQSYDTQLASLSMQIANERETARLIYVAAQAAAGTALTDLNNAFSQLDNVRAGFATDIQNATSHLQWADGELAKAKAEVNRIKGLIADLDRSYNSLNDIEKIAAWLGYQATRGSLLLLLEAANDALSLAQGTYNLALSGLTALQQALAAAEKPVQDLIASLDKIYKDALAEVDRTRQIFESIAEDPRFDPRYIAMEIARQAVVLLLQAAEDLVKLTSTIIQDAAGLIQFISQFGEEAVLEILKVTFRAHLADLNSGFAELTVDALLLNEPQQIVFVMNLLNGLPTDGVAEAARLLAPMIYPAQAWSALPWTSDADTGLSSTATIWAYRFNANTATSVNTVPVSALAGTSPAVSGRVLVQGFTAPFGGDLNALTAGSGGSAVIATNFIYGANPGTIIFQGLKPGRSYRATFLSVGWDAAPATRSVTFSSPDDSFIVDQNLFGNNSGIRIDHVFTAAGISHTVTIQPNSNGTFHLYGLALNYEGNPPLTFAAWRLNTFGANAYNPLISGDDADPDLDGISNRMEYALRSNPQAHNPLPFGPPVPVGSPVQAWQFAFPFQSEAADLVYHLQHSTDGVSWSNALSLNPDSSLITHIEGISTAPDAQAQHITITVSNAALIRGFWRLLVQ